LLTKYISSYAVGAIKCESDLTPAARLSQWVNDLITFKSSHKRKRHLRWLTRSQVC